MSDESDIDPDDQRIDADIDNEIEQRRQTRKQTKLERELEEEDRHWRQQLSTKIGRRAIYKMFDQSKLWETPFAVGPNGFPQPEATWFQAGERDLARRIYDKLQILDYAAVYLMMCENNSRFAKAPVPTQVQHAA